MNMRDKLKCRECNSIMRPVAMIYSYTGGYFGGNANECLKVAPRSIDIHSPEFMRLCWICPTCSRRESISEIGIFIDSRLTYFCIPYDIKADFLKHKGVPGYKRDGRDYYVDAQGKQVNAQGKEVDTR